MREAKGTRSWVEYSSMTSPGQNDQRILTIGTDASIFEPGAPARSRIEAYGRMFREFHVISYTRPGFRIERLSPTVTLYATNMRFFFMQPFRAFWIGRRIIHERKIDWISAQDPSESGLAGWLLKRWSGTPLQLQIHTDFASPYFRTSSRKDYVRSLIARFVIPRGERLRVVSERIRRSLIARFKILDSRITVLPIFVDREAMRISPPSFNLHERYPQFDFIVLMVSRLVREKNVGLAIRAFSNFVQEFPAMGLVIVGDGPERANLESRIKNSELRNAVRFEGWQSDLVSYYKTADLYLLTSNFEGYARSVIDAAAAGLPIIMTDVGVAGEIIRDQESGRVVPVGGLRALVAALRAAHRDYPAMKQMAERARALVFATSPRTFDEYLKRYQASFL